MGLFVVVGDIITAISSAAENGTKMRKAVAMKVMIMVKKDK